MNRDWSNSKVSHGNGDKIPLALKQLENGTALEKESAYWTITNLVVLQSSLFESAYFTIDPLINILESEVNQDKYFPLDILYEIFNGYAEPTDFITIESGQLVQLTFACRIKILNNIERIRQIITVTEKEHLAKISLLELIAKPNEMFPTKDSAINLLKSLGHSPSAGGFDETR